MSARKKRNLEERFREIYPDDLILPKAWQNRVKAVSCLGWREEQQVYLAGSTDAGVVVIKTAKGIARELLRKEAENLKKLSVSFVPYLIEYRTDAECDWLMREYIAGDTLWEWVERKGPLSADEAGKLMLRLCSMTAQLHEMEPAMIHRDLKPQNIVLTEEKNLFFIDMATGRQYRDKAGCDTVFVGTRQTAAPEQYGYSQTDCRTDIYALGIVYQYLLTGSMVKMDEHWVGEIPSACRQIIEKCTRLDPAQRYQNCEELKKALSFKTDDINAVPKKRRRRRMFVMSALLCLMLTFFWLWNTKREHPYVFQSETIEMAVRMQLHKTNGEEIYRKDLEQIETLRICGQRILSEEDIHTQHCGEHLINYEEYITDYGAVSDLTDCSYMKNLHTLVLDMQQIYDLTPLSNLPLTELSICDNPLRSLEPLSEIETLERLYLEEAYVVDVAPLRTLPNLTVLDISFTRVKSLRQMEGCALKELAMVSVWLDDNEVIYSMPLERLALHSFSKEMDERIGQMTTLKDLTIYEYQHSELLPLLELSALQKLDLFGGCLTSLKGVERFSDLRGLVVGRNEISDLSPMAALKKLESIGVEETKVTDFEALQNLAYLGWVRCDRTQYEKLLEAIPTPWFEIEISDQ